MSKRRKNRRKHGRKSVRKQRQITMMLSLAVLGVLLLGLLLFFLWGNGKKQAETTAPAGTAAASGEAESTGGDGANAGEEAAEEKEADLAGDGTEQEPEQEETGTAGIAAEVGSMDDAEDPQGSANTGSDGGAGAAVSIQPGSAGETEDLTLGIDVSKYQKTIDWKQVKEAGVEFAMVRVGYRTKSTGIIYEDPAARYNLQEAQANGIKLGAYFFSSAVTKEEAVEEAAWVADFIAQYRITYPVAYNCEDFQSQDSRQYGLGKEERSELAAAFLDRIEEAGYTPMFYASRNEMENSAQWNMEMLGQNYKVWVSQYPEKPYPETPSASYSGAHQMWQYTSQGSVAGISGPVDVNVAYFGYEKEAEARDPSPVQIVEANPEIGQNFTETEELVTAKIEANLRTLPTTGGESKVVASLKNGETVQRTATSSAGWSRVIYQGQKLYAVSSYLTTDLTPTGTENTGTEGENAGTAGSGETASGTDSNAGSQKTASEGMAFTAVSEAVTAKNVTNLRSKPSTGEDSQIVGTLQYGEAVVRTGINESSGWSRLEVNGQTVYAVSSYLVTNMDYKTTDAPTADQPEKGSRFSAVNDLVTAKIETNLRDIPSTEGNSQVVGVLKNGEAVQRTGIEKDKGWSRLVVDGRTVYAVTSYLMPAQ